MKWVFVILNGAVVKEEKGVCCAYKVWWFEVRVLIYCVFEWIGFGSGWFGLSFF
jgi:hypothetical protein